LFISVKHTFYQCHLTNNLLIAVLTLNGDFDHLEVGYNGFQCQKAHFKSYLSKSASIMYVNYNKAVTGW